MYNTFASPAVMRPLEWGVDLVIESASKFIGGHNDVIGGAICMKSERLADDFLEQIRWNTMVKWCAFVTLQRLVVAVGYTDA